jgi:hypothetical protein
MKGNCWPELEDFFYHPEGAAEYQDPMFFAQLISMMESSYANSAGSCIPFAPIRVREKRMNTYMTPLRA